MVLNGLTKIDHKFIKTHSNGSSITRSPGLVSNQKEMIEPYSVGKGSTKTKGGMLHLPPPTPSLTIPESLRSTVDSHAPDGNLGTDAGDVHNVALPGSLQVRQELAGKRECCVKLFNNLLFLLD